MNCSRHIAAARIGSTWSALLMLTLLSGCTSDVQPIRYGADTCTECRMVVDQPRFATTILTPKGRTLNFDSIECLVQFLRATQSNYESMGHSRLLVSVDDTGKMIDVENAFFVRDESVRTPMGGGLIAFETIRPDAIRWHEVVTSHP